MLASRLVANVSLASVAIIGACAAIWLFPLLSSAQSLPDDTGIIVDTGGPLVHRTPVRYPQGSVATGDVLVELTLNPKGEVADARVLSGPGELRRAALASVLEWHYAADTAPPSLVHATIHFGQRPAGVAPPVPPPPPPPPPSPGVRLSPGSAGQIGTGIGGGTGAGGGFGDGGGAYRIGGGVSAPIAILKPDPEYTDEAREAKLQGAVLLQVVIDENGVPQEIKVVRSLGLGLDQKAVEAMQKWRFKPAMKDEKPVPISANVEMNFRPPM